VTAQNFAIYLLTDEPIFNLPKVGGLKSELSAPHNFEAVVEKAKIACFNSAHPVNDHFVDVTEMTEINHHHYEAVE